MGWMREQREEQRKAREENRLTWNELRLKAEIDAWRAYTKEKGVKLTQENIEEEYKKMWPKRREVVQAAWTAEEKTMLNEVEAWRKQHKEEGVKLDRVNIKSEFVKMWMSVRKELKTDLTIVQLQKEFLYVSWHKKKYPNKDLQKITKLNIDTLYEGALKEGLKGTVVEVETPVEKIELPEMQKTYR